MRRFSLLIIALLLCQLINGQNLTVRYQSGGAPVNMTTSNITSDFGRRHSVWGSSWSPSPWHKGIDYAFSNCDGIPIISIASGRVSKIENLNPTGTTHYKILTIDGGTWSGTTENPVFTDNFNDFGYGHIFNDNDIGNGILSGNFVFLRMDGNNSNRFAILNLNITPHVAIGEVEGTVTYNGNPYNVRTRVDNDQLIAPIGGSGGFAANPHLHLYRPVNPANNVQDINNAKNPFEIVAHAAPNYLVTIDQVNRLTLSNSSQPTWHPCSGLNTENNSSVRVKIAVGENGVSTGSGMIYNSSAYDIEDVRVLIKRSFENNNAYRLISGLSLESRITMGGRRNSNRYPSAGDSDIAWVPTTNTPFNGSFTRTGIEPHAYHDGNYDFFDFSDFYTRLHKYAYGLATLNIIARYPDGKHYIKVRAERVVTGNPIESAASSIIIDNFRPYLEKIEVFNAGLNYSAEWELNSTETLLTLKTDGSKKPLDRCNSTKIVLTFTEPMQSCTLKVGSNTINAANQTNSEQWDRMKWEYLIPVMGLPATDTDLIITGTDLAGNQLTGFSGSFTPSSTQTVAVSQLPVRTSSTGFSNASVFPTSQTGYKLIINSSKDNPDCNTNYDSPPVAGFSYSYNNGNLTQISFVNTSYYSLYYHWDFGNGQTSTSREPGIIDYPCESFGQYFTVTLTAFNADNLQSSITKSIFIPGTDGDGGVTAIGYHTWLSGDCYQFTCSASGAFRYTIKFNMGDGSSHTVTNSMGNESYIYTYTKSSISSYYTPTIHVEGYDDTGYFIGENFTPLFSILVDRDDIGELSINIDIVNGSGQKITPIINSPFFLKANCTNYQEGLTWQWVIYNTNSPGDNSMQCNTNNGCKVFWGQILNTFITPEISISNAGKYYSQLTVWGGGYSRTIDFEIDVLSGSQCVVARFLITSTFNQQTFRKGSIVCINDASAITSVSSDCYNSNNTPKYHDIAQLEWRISGNNNSNFLRKCFTGHNFHEGYNVECRMPDFPTNSGYNNFELNSSGTLTITLKAWAGKTNTYSSVLDIQENIYNQVTKSIKVIDCDKLITLKTNMDVLRNMSNRIISKGVVNIQPTDNITLDSSWGDKIVFSANTSITIKPGFSAVAGSDLLFKIDPCPPLTSGCTSGKENYFDLLKDDLNISDGFLSIYPNPTSGSFVIELTNDNEFISSIEVFNIAGQQVDSREKVNSFYCELNLVDEPDGAYIVRVQTQRGKQFTAKVIKAR